MPKATIPTRYTQRLADIPKHARPEEFLSDEDLAGLYERELEDLKDKDPKRPEIARQLRRARAAAALTAAVLAEAEAEAAATRPE